MFPFFIFPIPYSVNCFNDLLDLAVPYTFGGYDVFGVTNAPKA